MKIKHNFKTWAAYYASKLDPPSSPPATSYMLLIFTESPNNPTIVWHGMKVIGQAINQINPGQIPVMEANLPLFIMAKKFSGRIQGKSLVKILFL